MKGEDPGLIQTFEVGRHTFNPDLLRWKDLPLISVTPSAGSLSRAWKKEGPLFACLSLGSNASEGSTRKVSGGMFFWHLIPTLDLNFTSSDAFSAMSPLPFNWPSSYRVFIFPSIKFSTLIAI